MNERLRELMIQADYAAPEIALRAQRLAELIVKECAKRVDYWESRQGEHTEDLLKHFGVE